MGVDVVRSAPVLGGLSVALVVLGGWDSLSLAPAFERAGACVRVDSALAPARGGLTPCCGRATVIVSPPELDGGLLWRLPELGRHGVVLVLSQEATAEERIELLDHGADTVLGSVDPDEVVASLAALWRRALRAGHLPVSPVVAAGEIRLHVLRRTATAQGRALALTPLEFDLLAYFIAHVGQALSRQRLLVDVWGFAVGGLDTVTVHVGRLRAKIEQDPSRPALLQTVRGIGYRLDPDAPLVARAPIIDRWAPVS